MLRTQIRELNPALTDAEIEKIVDRALTQERDLVVRGKLNLDQAREIARAEMWEEVLPNELAEGRRERGTDADVPKERLFHVLDAEFEAG